MVRKIIPPMTGGTAELRIVKSLVKFREEISLEIQEVLGK